MQANNLAFVLEQAAAGSGAFAKAVRDSIEVGVVVPSILRAKLSDAGFTVADDKVAVADYGFASLGTLKRVLVTHPKQGLVAMGASSDLDDALLHAVLGYFREHPSDGADIPAGIAEAPVNPHIVN